MLPIKGHASQNLPECCVSFSRAADQITQLTAGRRQATTESRYNQHVRKRAFFSPTSKPLLPVPVHSRRRFANPLFQLRSAAVVANSILRLANSLDLNFSLLVHGRKTGYMSSRWGTRTSVVRGTRVGQQYESMASKIRVPWRGYIHICISAMSALVQPH
jgi:hypothetical protein